MDLPPNYWASLPESILRLLVAALSDDDYIRFRTVCRSWHAPFRRLLPHLMIRHLSSDPIDFHKLIDHSISFSCIPDPADATFCGSSHGWIAFRQRNGDVFLIEPVSGARIELPSVHSIDKAKFYRKPTTNVVIGDVFLSKSPRHGADCIVLATLPMATSVAIWKPGDLVWTTIDIDMFIVGTAVYCSDRFYLTDFSSVVELDVGPPIGVRIIKTPEAYASFHIFRLLNWQGELLVLYRSMIKLTKKRFLLFKYTQDGLNDWTEVASLGHSTMFISVEHHSCIIGSQFEGCSSNCIYISGSGCNMVFLLGMSNLTGEAKTHFFSVFNLENDEVEHMLCDWLPKTQIPDINTWIAI